MKQIFATTALLALALAACQQGADDNLTIDESNSLNADVETLPPDETVDANIPDDNGAALNEAEDDSEDSPSTVAIPAQYRGGWGMNANDCDPSRSDNKGLMTVEANRIRFYESVASLQERRPSTADSFSGTFSFVGEGQSWERAVTLTRDGNVLTRAQSEGTFTYKRCA